MDMSWAYLRIFCLILSQLSAEELSLRKICLVIEVRESCPV